MKLKTIRSLIFEGFEYLIKNKLLSIITITTIFISMFLFSAFYIFIDTINDNINNMQQRVEIVAFLDESIEENDVDKFKADIESIENIKTIDYISKEEGLEALNNGLIEDGDTEMVSIINEVVDEGENPIPASLVIKTIDSTKNNEVKEKLISIDEIYKVTDSNVVTSFLNSLSKYTRIIGIVIMSLLMAATVFLISNSIKVSVFVRKKEISIIKYIGATNWYIRLPFIVEGLFLGIIGAFITLVTIGILYSLTNVKLMALANNLISGFVMPEPSTVMILLATVLIIIGGVIGIFGSLISIRKYLKV